MMNSFFPPSFGVPVVSASSVASPDESPAPATTTLASLPLYREDDEFQFHVEPPSQLEEAVRKTRLQAEAFKEANQSKLDRIANIYSTAIAHSTETLIRIQDKDNIFTRIGVMTAGGVLGLFASRKGSFVKKVAFISLSISAAGAVCYPEESKLVVQGGANAVKKAGRVAYNFAIGARPTVGHQDGKAFDKMSTMVSDVGQYGFKLFQRKPAAPKEGVVEAAKETVMGETPAVEAVGEVVEETVEKNINEIVQETVESVPETIVAEEADKAAETSGDEEAPVVSIEEESAAKIEGDPGQGLAEDKEMYTTRT